jgi:hypothetical protein
MAEKTVVVVGSSESAAEYEPNYFWVIDFSNAASGGTPSAVQVGLSAGSGCVVACSGTLAAVGNCTGPGSVSIYDISRPSEPGSVGSTGLPFDGIGAIAIYSGFVLAAEANGFRIALIDISSLTSPQIFDTGLDTVTGVAIFGEYAVVCGTFALKNAFQAANLTNLSSLRGAGATSFSPESEYEGPVTCDFDGTHAVFSDGSGVYVFGISSGIPTTNPVVPSGGQSGVITSVTIAESGAGGVITASAGNGNPNVDLTYFVPVTPKAKLQGATGSLGEPIIQYGQVAETGAVAQFNRTISGTSSQLAAAGVTQTASGVQEYVVTLFSVATEYSAGTGSIAVTQQGPRATVQLPSTQNATLGITTFDIFIIKPPYVPLPVGLPIEKL